MFSNGLLTLLDTEPVSDQGTDICPKNGYNSDWGSGFGLESKSRSYQWEAIGFGVGIRVSKEGGYTRTWDLGYPPHPMVIELK